MKKEEQILKESALKEGILAKYQQIKSTSPLTIGKIQGKLIKKCLSGPLLGDEKKALEDFLEIGIKDNLPNAIKKRSNYDKFRSVLEFLNANDPNRKVNKENTLAVAAIFVGYPIETPEQPLVTPQETPKGISLHEMVKAKYATDDRFQTIQVYGDKENIVGKLQMEQYYIQLSYINSSNLKHRDTLLQLEKEYSSYKVNYDTSNFFVPKATENYITEEILHSFQKIIITGNPGVGKSTFAKWLCHSCATRPENDILKTFVYVELRQLDFESSTFLLDYLVEEYFPTYDTRGSSLSSLLNQIQNYQLLLDGFDELTQEHRERLVKKTRNFNYIILSRPYGLLGNTIVDDVSLQIDGFNPDSIQYYIQSLLDREKHPDKTPQGLLNILTAEKNQILLEYAHNPLMLSFITFIYLSSPNPKVELSSIESTYDLQHSVYAWMLKYAMDKPGASSKKMNGQTKKITAFAYDKLQIKKLYIYTDIYEQESDEYQITHHISKIGLGSKREYSKNTARWQFSFNTVVFQEFFAAKFLEDKIIQEQAILHFVSDHFFWNFSKMLFGSLRKKNNDELIQKTLNLLEEQYTSQNQEYYGYAYYMLLSECSSAVISEMLDSNSMQSLIEFYEKTFLDKFWKKTHSDTIRKIFYKASPEVRALLVHELNTRIVGITNFSVDEMKNVALDYILDLIPLCKKHDEASLVTSLIFGLDYLTNLYMEDDDPYLRLSINEYFSALLVNGSKEILRKNIDQIKKLDEKIGFLGFSVSEPGSNPFFYSDIGFEFYFEKLAPILDGYPDHITEINTLYKKISRFRVPIKVKENHLKTLCDFAELLFKYVNSQDKWNTRDSLYLTEKIAFTGDFLKPLSEEELIKKDLYFYVAKINDFLLCSYVQLNDPQYYNAIFKFMLEHDYKLYLEIPNEKAFLEYIDHCFSIAEKEIDNLKHIDLLIIALEVTKLTNLNSSFYRFKQRLFQLFHNLIKLEEKSIKTNSIITPKQIKIVQFLQDITSVFYQPFHKKFFFNQIRRHGLADFKFVSSEVILKRISPNLSFYEKDYWNFYENLLANVQWRLESIMPLITNPRLFLFEFNCTPTFALFIQTFRYRDHYFETIEQGQLQKIMTLIANLLMNVPNVSQDTAKETLEIIEKILYHKNVLENGPLGTLDQYDESEFGVLDLEDETPFYSIDILGHSLLAYTLFYYYVEDERNFLFNFDLELDFMDYPEVFNILFDLLITFFEDSNGQIPVKQVEKIRPLLREHLYLDLMEIINKRQANNTFNLEYISQYIS